MPKVKTDPPSAPSFLNAQVDEDDGTVVFWWNPAIDDLTPEDALTYDLRLYRDGSSISTAGTLPEPGSLSAVAEWRLAGLPDGLYTWTLRAVDSAYNGGEAAEGSFVVGVPISIFADGYESGDLTQWSAVSQ